MGNTETKEAVFEPNYLHDERDDSPSVHVGSASTDANPNAVSPCVDIPEVERKKEVRDASKYTAGVSSKGSTIASRASGNVDGRSDDDTGGIIVAMNATNPTSRIPQPPGAATVSATSPVSGNLATDVASGEYGTFPNGIEIQTVGVDSGHIVTSTRSINSHLQDDVELDGKPNFCRRSTRFPSLLTDEIQVRNSVIYTLGATGMGGVYNVIGSFILNLISSFFVFAVYLIGLESLLSIGLSVGLTIYTYNVTKDSTTFKGDIMTWVLLSFAVITPLSASIGMAFNRRDAALQQIAEFKAVVLNLFSSHACWDWCNSNATKPTGRAASSVDWLDHTDQVLHSMFLLCTQVTRLLTLPTAGRARHYVFPHGQHQREELALIARKLHRSILEEMAFITTKCEVLKREGLPPNEATRVRQWERGTCQAIEKLLTFKKYRTPQALRSFGRLFTVFLSPFYAPYYGQMATDLNSLGMAIAFSVITSLSLTSLFECVSQLEDPYVGSRLDCINVEAELRDEFLVQLVDVRDYHYPHAPPFEAHVQIPVTKRGPEIRLFQAS